MAKFKLKASLIPKLKERGIVSADDKMVLRIPHRVKGSKEQMFELEFDVSEAIETDNRLAAQTVRHQHSPRIKSDGEWYIADPAIAWFDELPEEDTTTTKQPHVHGDEVLTKNERKTIHFYLKATSAEKPASWKKTDAAATLAAANAHFSS